MARHLDLSEIQAAYKECFNSEAGKIVLSHMVTKFGFINGSTNVPGDPYGTHINEGHRGVLVYIGRMLSDTPVGQVQAKDEENEAF